MLRLFLAILTTVTVSASLPFNVQHEGQNGASAAGIAVGACLVFIHTLFVLACCFCACSPRFTLASPAAKAKPFSRKVSKTGLDIFVGDKIRNVRRQSRISAI
jgi:ABC-type tungstate transport system substrate-binding protein